MRVSAGWAGCGRSQHFKQRSCAVWPLLVPLSPSAPHTIPPACACVVCLQQPLQANACYSIIRRCFEAFKSGEGGIVPLLRTARDLLSLLQLGPKSKVRF